MASFFPTNTVFLPGRLENVNECPMRIDVVKSTDCNRGFRLFDNAVFVVRDVASEELFLERIRIVHGVFEKVVEPFMDSSMFVLANKLVVATKVCISQYFNAQSLARTGRPFIVSAEYRDSPSLFCGCSDFLRAYLYTKRTGDPFLDDESYDPTDDSRGRRTTSLFSPPSDAHGDPNRQQQQQQQQQYLSDREMEMEACRLKWQLGSLQAKRMVEGGPNADLNVIINPDAIDPDRYGAPMYHQQSSSSSRRPEAVLYVIADTTALAEFLCYMFYMTPVELKRRYEVNTGCAAAAASTVSSATSDNLTRAARACCYEESKRYNSSDTVRRAIQEFLRRRQEAKVAASEGIYGQVSLSDVDPTFAELLRKENREAKAQELRKRNDTLVKNLLLLLFDKSLSSIIDNGFDNANKRRRYGTNAKSVGGATVYTGILDTVGKVLVRYREGVSLSQETRATKTTTPKNVRIGVAENFLNLRIPLSQDTVVDGMAAGNGTRLETGLNTNSATANVGR